MLRILVATSRPEAFRAFVDELSSDPAVGLDYVTSGADALDTVRKAPPHLVVIDSTLPDAEPLSLASKLLMVNAMVNTAVVSSLSEQQFHEASEGLGVLAGVPVEPARKDAVDLLDKLRKVLGQMG